MRRGWLWDNDCTIFLSKGNSSNTTAPWILFANLQRNELPGMPEWFMTILSSADVT